VWVIFMMRSVRPALLAMALCVGAAAPVLAAGATTFEAAAGPHNYLVTNHPAVLPHLTPSVWLLGSYSHDPLVYRDENGDQLGASIVEHQVNAELAAALGLFDRFEVGLVIPGYWMKGNGFGDGGQKISAAGLGDLRLLAKLLLTPWNEGVVASVRLQSNIVPISRFTTTQAVGAILAGDTLPDVTPAVSVGYNHERFKLGLDVGAHLRFPRTFDAQLKAGSAITYGVGAEVQLVPRTVALTADVWGRAAPKAFGSDQNRFPLEGALALKNFLGPVVILIGAGTGLIPDYSAPDLRVFASLGFFPQPEEKKEPEPEEEPAPVVVLTDEDRDGDGILDKDDECPDEPEDKDGFEDEDGCPEPDNDKDGIADKKDKCPNDPEDKDRWEDEDGCPEPDNDKDKILDPKDECPNDPEVMNGFEDEDGCPDDAGKKKLVVVKRDKIEILDKVYFATNSDRILPKSYDLLNNVASVINDHKEIPAIFVEGHTDSDGPDTSNLDLSDRRAKSVMKYLTETGGVDAARVKAKGYGEAKPIDTNKTPAGKANNRRVEFRIINADGSELSTESGATIKAKNKSDDKSYDKSD
jgi:large repetitive protein